MSNNSKILLAIGFLFIILPVSVFAQSSGGFELGRETLLPIHIPLMSIAFASMSTGAFIARYRKQKTKNWLKLHKTFQWTSAIAGVLGIITGFVMVQNYTQKHFRVAHSFIALASLLLIVCAVVLAYGFLKRKNHKKELRIMHRWIGRFTILSFLTTVVFGIIVAV